MREPENNDKKAPGRPAEGFSKLVEEKPSESNAIKIPQISLPKGGGALKGIDEKFEVNAANGTASFSIPLPITPGRNNFSPALSLSYNSGAGNSPFGLGWSLNLPSILRKTDKALPRYLEGNEEDTFMFSGAEDLVPFLVEQEDGSWTPPEPPPAGDNIPGDYTIRKYRPRVEGSFARIEKISHPQHGLYWRVTTRDNITTFFGRHSSCRIADPEYNIADPEINTRIFEWLPEFSFDNKGNWIRYEYKEEKLDQVPNELHEANRHDRRALFTNRYLKRVLYGNKAPYFLPEESNPYDPQQPPDDATCFFELVFDYGEHDGGIPLPTETDENAWPARPDAFSSYRSGFEIRTYRLCRRVLMFHHFPDEVDFGMDYLVRSLDFNYIPSSINGSGQAEVTYLQSITQTGYIRRGSGSGEDVSYSSRNLPPLEFTYQHLNWNTEVKVVDDESIVHAPVGLTNNYQWVDLYGEGISGILTEQAEGWFYKSNLGVDDDGLVTFTQAQPVIPKPSFTGLTSGVLSLQDLEANGKKQVVINSNGLHGFFELTEDNDWKPFTAFTNIPNVDLRDPNTRLIDLNGDGQPELVITEENVFVWYAANGKQGYKEAERSLKTFDEEQGPSIVFADQEQTIFLADMSGDGMTDIVRIRNGEISYWANKGYGRFSAKVNMSNAPFFDFPDAFNPKYLHLADVSGTGATDIIYTGQNLFNAYINLSGNGWSDAHEIEPFFSINSNNQISVVDLLGTGTSCIVWSSDLPADVAAPMRYIDLMDSKKPHVMIKQVNNLGKETSLEYKSSTYFYLKDKLEGNPWITKLPFPVQVIARQTVEDKITQVRFASEYRYHHGYYDHPEREFRGFGMVEQRDTELYETWQKSNVDTRLEQSEALYQAPTLVKTWFHTGAFLDRERILTHYQKEYWHERYHQTFPDESLTVSEPQLSDARVVSAKGLNFDINDLSPEEWREALRACKGMMLRQEVFALDAEEDDPDSPLRQAKPYTVTTHNCHIQLLQPKSGNRYAVFMPTESEAISISYERDESDPRIAHCLNLEIDGLGNVLEAAAIMYPRKISPGANPIDVLREELADLTYERPGERETYLAGLGFLQEEQKKTLITYTKNFFTNDLEAPDLYRLRLPTTTLTYEITGLAPSVTLFQVKDFSNVLADPERELANHALPDPGEEQPQYRLIEHIQSTYYNDTLNDELTLSELGRYGIPYQSYQLAYTPELLQEIFGDKLPTDPAELENLLSDNDQNTDGDNRYSQCHFVHRDDANWWIRSGTTRFYLNDSESLSDIQNRFFTPQSFLDPFGSQTRVSYYRENYFLVIESATDALENQTRVERFNFRTLSPVRMRDINDNLSEVLLDELGLVKAMAVMGKGEEADKLDGLSEITSEAERGQIQTYFTLQDTDDLIIEARSLIQHATARFVYDFDRYQRSVELREEQINLQPCEVVKLLPTVAGSITREQHDALNPESPLQLSFAYSDGIGNVAMTKVQAEPGNALQLNIEPDCRYTLETVPTGPNLRWIGNGRTVLNNKGNPVKQYEPYFSVNPFYEDAKELVERGVTPILYYDALGRNIKTELPDGTFTQVAFDSWQQQTYGQNDTVLDTSWYAERISGSLGTAEQEAAQKALVHNNTPNRVYLDTLGRPILSVEHNRWLELHDGEPPILHEELYATRIQLDIEGNASSVVDARGNDVMAWKYNMLGHRIFQQGMDCGRRWMLNNVAGNPIQSWDEREHLLRYTYDILQRPLTTYLSGGDRDTPFAHTINRIIYGEGLTNDRASNLRGQAYQVYEASGGMQHDHFDFKGNLLEARRLLAADYEAEAIHWPENPPDSLLESETFTKRTEYDALNRMTRLENWHSDRTRVGIYVPTYNARGVLQSENFSLGEETTPALVDIRYNEKGQRTRMQYGNDTVTSYDYDPTTYRLLLLRTTSEAGSRLHQELHYTYDPVGNITEIRDDAYLTTYFNNERIEPRSRYTYDSLYRMIEAHGRENNSFNSAPGRQEAEALSNVSFPVNDPNATRNYIQNYRYDSVGNILRMHHMAGLGRFSERWTRHYYYAPNSNHLDQTHTGNPADTIDYAYDLHGSMLNITNSPDEFLLRWDYRDMIHSINLGNGQAWYQYDVNKQRTRKRIHYDGGITRERIYLEGLEIYRAWRGTSPDPVEVIETHHLFADNQRVLIVENVRTSGTSDLPEGVLYRYQYSNHLGSVGLELNVERDIISYEEYHPFGTTAYRAKGNAVHATAKRYRYTGMERDGESGLSYHTARYYLPWLGRWCSVDPKGLIDGINLFIVMKDNPIRFSDDNGSQTVERDMDAGVAMPLPPGGIDADAGANISEPPPVSTSGPRLELYEERIWLENVTLEQFRVIETEVTASTAAGSIAEGGPAGVSAIRLTNGAVYFWNRSELRYEIDPGFGQLDRRSMDALDERLQALQTTLEYYALTLEFSVGVATGISVGPRLLTAVGLSAGREAGEQATMSLIIAPLIDANIEDPATALILTLASGVLLGATISRARSTPRGGRPAIPDDPYSPDSVDLRVGTRTLSQQLADDIGDLGLSGADRSLARQEIFRLADQIGSRGYRTLAELEAAFPNRRVHQLTGNLRGWISIDPVAGNPHAFRGGRLLVRPGRDSIEFMVRNTH